jgi:hypothetical protein
MIQRDHLADARAVFQRWLFLPDPRALYVVLATVVAHRRDGDPLWLLLVARQATARPNSSWPSTG